MSISIGFVRYSHFNGRKFTNEYSLLDIVEIIPKAFDFKDIEVGMCFKYSGEEMWFMCKFNSEWVFTNTPKEIYESEVICFDWVKGNKLITRLPEKDIPNA